MRKLKKMMSPMSAEATVVRNYIDWLWVVPAWHDYTEEKHRHRSRPRRVLNEDHYGLRRR